MLVSIRMKVFSTLVVLNLIGFVAIAYVSINAITRDKRQFLQQYQSTLLDATNLSIMTQIRLRLEELQVFANYLYFDAQPNSNPFASVSQTLREDLARVTFLRKSTDGKYTKIKEFSNPAVSQQSLDSVDQHSPLQPQEGPRTAKLAVYNRSIPGEKLTILTFTMPCKFLKAPEEGLLLTADFSQDFLRRALKRSELSQSFLLTKQGYVISHNDLAPILEYKSKPIESSVLNHLEKFASLKESQELPFQDSTYFFASTFTELDDVFLVSQIPKAAIYYYIDQTTKLSILIACLYLFFAMVFALWIAGRFSRNLKKLTRFLIESLEGKQPETFKTSDEIGKIVHSVAPYLRGTRKGTVLNPPPNVQHENFHLTLEGEKKISGAMLDRFQSDKRLTLMMVENKEQEESPLFAMKGILTSLQAIYEGTDLAPDNVLEFINKSLFTIYKGKITIHALIAQIDLETSQVLVSSTSIAATHEKAGVAHKVETKGEPLGFNPSGTYSTVEVTLQPGDHFLVTTSQKSWWKLEWKKASTLKAA